MSLPPIVLKRSTSEPTNRSRIGKRCSAKLAVIKQAEGDANSKLPPTIYLDDV